jgi:hypothetical protein
LTEKEKTCYYLFDGKKNFIIPSLITLRLYIWNSL